MVHVYENLMPLTSHRSRGYMYNATLFNDNRFLVNYTRGPILLLLHRLEPGV